MQRGKIVILLILLLGTLAGIVSVWMHYRGGRRALDYFGRRNALLLRDADKVTLARLLPAGSDESSNDLREINNRKWSTERQLDVTHRAGALYIRESLLHDSTYDWSKQAGDCEAKKLFLLEFRSGKDRMELVLDIECQTVRVLRDQERPAVSIAPAITFFEGWLKQQLP